jgi:hypothetical protein
VINLLGNCLPFSTISMTTLFWSHFPYLLRATTHMSPHADSSSPATGASFHVKRMGNEPMTNRRLFSFTPIPKTPCHIEIPYFRYSLLPRLHPIITGKSSKPVREDQCFTIIGNGVQCLQNST